MRTQLLFSVLDSGLVVQYMYIDLSYNFFLFYWTLPSFLPHKDLGKIETGFPRHILADIEKNILFIFFTLPFVFFAFMYEVRTDFHWHWWMFLPEILRGNPARGLFFKHKLSIFLICWKPKMGIVRYRLIFWVTTPSFRSCVNGFLCKIIIFIGPN